jgi:hypothetical protein
VVRRLGPCFSCGGDFGSGHGLRQSSTVVDAERDVSAPQRAGTRLRVELWGRESPGTRVVRLTGNQPNKGPADRCPSVFKYTVRSTSRVAGVQKTPRPQPWDASRKDS